MKLFIPYPGTKITGRPLLGASASAMRLIDSSWPAPLATR
jgi:hypothetical protein